MMKAFTEAEYKATMQDPMVDVTASPGEVIDIWPYIASVASSVALPSLVLEKKLVEHVYRSGNGIYDHVLLPTEKENKFIVIIVDRSKSQVSGHYVLDLNKEYGLE